MCLFLQITNKSTNSNCLNVPKHIYGAVFVYRWGQEVFKAIQVINALQVVEEAGEGIEFHVAFAAGCLEPPAGECFQMRATTAPSKQRGPISQMWSADEIRSSLVGTGLYWLRKAHQHTHTHTKTFCDKKY